MIISLENILGVKKVILSKEKKSGGTKGMRNYTTQDITIIFSNGMKKEIVCFME